MTRIWTDDVSVGNTSIATNFCSSPLLSPSPPQHAEHNYPVFRYKSYVSFLLCIYVVCCSFLLRWSSTVALFVRQMSAAQKLQQHPVFIQATNKADYYVQQLDKEASTILFGVHWVLRCPCSPLSLVPRSSRNIPS